MVCLTSKKADPNVGHRYIIFKKAILASSGDIPESELYDLTISLFQSKMEDKNISNAECIMDRNLNFD